MDDNYVSRSDRGSSIARDELQEGDTVVMQWSPYGWTTDLHGWAVTSRMVVTVVTAPCDDIAGDAVLETPNGKRFRDYGGGRRYVAGPSAGKDGVPDRTDVGTGARYFGVNDR